MLTSDFTASWLKHSLWKKGLQTNMESKLPIPMYINKILWRNWMHQKYFCNLQQCKDNEYVWFSSRCKRCIRRCKGFPLSTEMGPRTTGVVSFGAVVLHLCCMESYISAGSQRLAVPFAVALALHSNLITHIYCKTVISIPLDFVHCHGSQSSCDTWQARGNCIFPRCKAAMEMEGMKLVSLNMH